MTRSADGSTLEPSIKEITVPDTLPTIRRSLELAPDMLASFVSDIPQRQLRVVRRPGFWTIEDHVLHLAEVQPMMFERLEHFRDEEHPNFVPYLPAEIEEAAPAQRSQTVPDALKSFREWRGRILQLIDTFPPAVWERNGSHPEYFSYTAIGLLRHLAMHDHWHMYRMEELWLTRDEFLTELQ